MEGEIKLEFDKPADYIVDTRPLCQGMPFVLTDSAHPRLVLKSGSHFLVLDRSAFVPACNTLGYGYYRFDTRYLSNWEIYLDDVPLSLMSFDVEKGYAGSFIYTNPQTPGLLQQKLMVHRQLVLSSYLAERLIVENYGSEKVDILLRIKFQSDFADIFEVRGLNRPERGARMLPNIDSSGKRLFLAYRGLDGCLLESIIEVDKAPHLMTDGEIVYRLELAPRSPWELMTRVHTSADGSSPSVLGDDTEFRSLLISADEEYSRWRSLGPTIDCEHEILNFSIERGLRDLFILRQPTPRGLGLAAGVPWYCAVFGRDSAIAAWQLLPFHNELARECIEVLAAYQGTQVDEFRAERPGKIMHELRLGELSRLGTIPHTPYYGTVDATALWVMLVARYLKWTGDLEFISKLWPQVKLAMRWLESFDDQGYLTYKRESPEGLENQGWKDSGDSVCHSDGSLAKPPIALCEVQGYFYGALQAVSYIAGILGHQSLSRKVAQRAQILKTSFERDFWMVEEDFPAIALDGDGQMVRSIASNAGHCIWAGILDGDKANRTADLLLSPEFDSGWGLRTLSVRSSYFNPMSYHNGSVWPHDNAIIAEGLRKLGRTADVHKIIEAMVSVAQHQQEFRLPELYCGFERNDWSRPIDYPVSCSPQAWSAGAIFQLLGACLNFHPDAPNKILRIVNPSLPDWLEQVTIRKLRIGAAELDIAFSVIGGHTSCQVLRKVGDLKVIIET